MLNDKSISVAAQVAAGLSNQGLVLTPINGSPLSVAMNAMQVIADREDTLAAVRDAATPVSTAFDQHTGEIRNAVAMLSARLSANLNLAQNTVNPLCRSIVLACEQRKRETEANSLLNVKVLPVKAMSLFSSPDLDAKLTRFKEGVYRQTQLARGLTDGIKETVTNDDIRSALQKGTASWDANLDELFENLAAVGLTPKDVLFSAPGYEYGRKEMLTDATALINFLFIDALLAGRVESYSLNDVSLNDRTELSKAHAFYGYSILTQIRGITDLAKSNRFIFTLSSTAKLVYVYYRNYTEWLKNGGSAEALIAATARSRGNFNEVIVRLTNEPSYYEEEYKRIESHTRDMQRVDIIGKLQALVQEKIYTYIHSELEESAVDVAAANAKAFFAGNRIQANTDIAKFVRSAVCAVLAQNSSVEAILNDMDYYMETHEDATFSKALAFSLGRLLGQHAALQINVTKDPHYGAEAPIAL